MKDKKALKLEVIVIILSYNGKYLLDDCVNSYLANDYQNFKVVVVDNGSTDGTDSYVKEKWPEVKLLRTDVNLKYSGGLNFGMKYAFDEQKADYVLITNNDVKADTKLVSSCVEVAVTDPKIAFVTGKVFYFEHPNVFQTVGKKADPFWWNAGHIGRGEKDNGQYDEVREIAWCDDIFWLVNRKVYDELGGYDTEFAFQGEDFDWQARAKQAGYKIFYSPKAKLWHKESMTIGKSSPFKAYYDARNPLIVHMKYRKKEEYLAVMKAKKKNHLKMSPKYILKGRIKYFFKVWQGYYSAVKWGKAHNKLP